MAHLLVARFCPVLLLRCSLVPTPAFAADWLINPNPFKARITQISEGAQLELTNGLLRRVLQLRPNAATITLENSVTGESLLRSIRPEAQLVLNGKAFDVGGLTGQPVHNYFDPNWLKDLKAESAAFHFAGLKIGPAEPRFPWKKHREWLST